MKFIVLILGFFLFPLYLNAKSAPPRLILKSAPLFDLECQNRTGFKVEPEWMLERENRLTEFQDVWNQHQNDLNRLSQRAAGRRYPNGEYIVSLILCKWTPMGTPFLVSVRRYLNSSAAADPAIGKASSKLSFVVMTHHELLHSLVENIEVPEFYSGSKMLQKYSPEPFNVKVHLHLMAIQKSVYGRLGGDFIRETDDLYNNIIGGDYKRAWEIVNIEGEDPFLKELRDWNRKK